MTGAMTTSGGNFEGPGTVTSATSATWEVAGSGSTSVSGGSLVNDGTATIDAIATLSIYSGATVTNNGTMTMYASSEIYGSNTNTILDNAGTLVVNPGSTGTATLAGGSLVINSTGSIQLSSGTLDISSGATLNLNAGSSVSGSGTLEDQGTLGVNSAQSLASPFVVQGVVAGAGALTVTGAMTTNGGGLRRPREPSPWTGT